MKRGSSAAENGARRNVGKLRSRIAASQDILIDRHRATVFPNTIRDHRKRCGYPKLLGLAQTIPDIPYIRLSKIERGEVFAKPEELAVIAKALRCNPQQLLVDIDDPDFDIAAWAADMQDPADYDAAEDRFAVLLAAALRARREADPALSIAALESVHGIPPVILSRLENAFKTIDRWNDATVESICRIFGVADVAALRKHVAKAHQDGALAGHVDAVAHPDLRIAKTRGRVAAIRDALSGKPAKTVTTKTPPPLRIVSADTVPDTASVPTTELPPVLAAIQAADNATVRLVPVFGTPFGDGLIARTPTGDTVEAPRSAGPRAYGLRVCRPTLGPALPARATVIVDPDRFPSAGGIAVVREADGLRLLTISFGRDGRMIGYSQHPDREIAIDAVDPADVATVIGALFE
ncbi:hypothetical protein ACFB49_45740 [Sphingomonas sp. DBB INV C78]|uniref:helix-turn-helix domain-containing protein n=1 Tax=Sphingomonas sp. DBB INV C78 TaxID=3349434 RepID=UPI0036D30FD0